MADNPFSSYLYRQQGSLFPDLFNPGGRSFGFPDPSFQPRPSFSNPFNTGAFAGGTRSLFPGLNFTDSSGIGALTYAVKQLVAANNKSSSPPPAPSSPASTSPSTTGSTLTGGDPAVTKWSSQIDTASQKFGIPADMIAGIMEIESSGTQDALSKAGAIGLMQIMPDHQDIANQYGGNLWDPNTNVMVGAKILRDNFDMAKKQYGVSDDEAWNIAAAAYLGDWSWNSGTYAGFSDAEGSTGPSYIQKLNAARSHYQTQQTAAAAPSGHGSVDAITNNQHYTVTQGFGPSDLSLEPAYNGYAHFHEGLDVGVPMDTPLTAPISGTIIEAGWNDYGFGNSVVIQTDDGFTIRLGHMDSVAVADGQRVDAGTLMGYSGNTGASTGPHTHIEVHDPDGNPIDPTQYFSID